MLADQPLSFGPYRCDPARGQLWRSTQAVKLTPKAFAVLRYFVEHPGQLVSKDDLFQAVWPQTIVSEATLASCIQELRQALRDDAKKPRYIETVHRRGYRWIASLTTPQPVQSPKSQVQSPYSTIRILHSAINLVGRDEELAQLHGWLEKALNGERQLVFVTGEPGIGKTSLVEAFLARLADAHEHAHDHALWLGRGQCIEHYGAGEAYLPILDALGRLCRVPDGSRLIALLKYHAPTWLVQMPALLKTAERETLQRTVAGATKERMLRELAEAVEVLTAERPLVLVLEDLHWSDVSTLDWLAFVARRQEPARLLVIGTYRPVEILTREHPLKGVKQELQVHGQCAELALDFLREEDVAEYLMQRFAGGAMQEWPFRRLTQLIHRRTDGNPLFMVNVANELMARGVLVQSDGGWELQGKVEEVAGGVPESLQQMIEQQIERLSPADRRVLEVASVAGAEFSTAAVAAGVATPIEEVEEQCGELARRERFLRASGTDDWPDGTVAARYGFLHALYQEVVYHRLTTGRRQRLHRQVGEREEQAYGERAREIAAELAVHFERGREYAKAVRYLCQAGENAARRSAYQEAVALITKGLEVLQTLPDTLDRLRQEIRMHLTLGRALRATKGHAALETENAFLRARVLCQQAGDPILLSQAESGLVTVYMVRGQIVKAHELAEQTLCLAQGMPSCVSLISAHHLLGETLYYLGELAAARAHAEQGITLCDSQKNRAPDSDGLAVNCRLITASILWVLGYPDQALQKNQEALALAQEFAHPVISAVALLSAAWHHCLRREARMAQEKADAGISLSAEHGFTLRVAQGTITRGWALSQQGHGEEGVAQIRQGMHALQDTAWAYRPSILVVLAEALGNMGQVEEGLAVLAEALTLVDRDGERLHAARLHQLKGELTLQQLSVASSQLSVPNPQPLTPTPQSPALSTQAEAEACFLKAIDIARQQQAKMWELRATVSLARLWQEQGKKGEARQTLAEIYNWFTEGFDTKDLQEAKALLEELT